MEMVMDNTNIAEGISREAVPEAPAWRTGFLRCLLAAALLLFFQAYMVAPLIPFLSAEFHQSRQTVGLAVPAYLLPYAFGTFAYGLFADRFGRRGVLFGCLAVFATCCLLTGTASSISSLLIWRAVTGLAGSGIAVIALTSIGDLFRPHERGQALGWLFGAIAGGSALGSTLGGILNPLIGWRALFVVVGAGCLVLLGFLSLYWNSLGEAPVQRQNYTARQILSNYGQLLGSARGSRTYGYILLNGIFHSGVFTWLGGYLTDRYHLSEAGIGLALLGYGIPGFFFGPIIGKVVDRYGRRRLIPAGLALAALCGAALIAHLPLAATMLLITLLSLGFDMSHPLLAGIVTTLAPEKRGQAMGLNTFTLFLGLSLGSLLFGWGMQHRGFDSTMAIFACVQVVLALAAVGLFRRE